MSIQQGDTVVVVARVLRNKEGEPVVEGARGTVVGWQGDDPIVDFDPTDPFMTFTVRADAVEAIRRVPASGKRR